MFNLTEKHIVVVIVLISVIFLLFLSTRTPMCIKEGFRGKNFYSEVNNDLFMGGSDFANADLNNSKERDFANADVNNSKVKKSDKLSIFQIYKYLNILNFFTIWCFRNFLDDYFIRINVN